MAFQCRYAAQGCSGQLRGRAEAVSRRAVERAARPSEEIRQPRVLELPLCLCVGLRYGEIDRLTRTVLCRDRDMSSRPEESHPRALPKPCVNLSRFTRLPMFDRWHASHRLHLVHGLLLLPDGVSWPVASVEQRSPFGPAPITEPSSLLRVAPPLCSASVLSSSRFWPLETLPLASVRQVLTFRTRARLSFAPPTCRMPLGRYQGFPRADPGGRVTPRF